MSARRQIVGVLGGMGPAATVHFMGALLAATPAQRDQDHLRVLVDNNPMLPDRNEALAGRGPSPGPALAEMARGLERAGADFLVMPCNTAHAFRSDIEEAVGVPLLSIIDVTVEAVLATGGEPAAVGLLAGPGALAVGLYQEAFAARGVQPLAPNGELRERLAALIYRIKTGATGPDSRAEMASIAAALVREGADVLASACTEVPLVMSAADAPVPLTDSIEALARATVARALAPPD